jgi:hypothetical protein
VPGQPMAVIGITHVSLLLFSPGLLLNSSLRAVSLCAGKRALRLRSSGCRKIRFPWARPKCSSKKNTCVEFPISLLFYT